MLAKLLQFGRRPSVVQRAEGFVYVSHADQGPMQQAANGAVISIAGRGPPWIVVNHDPASVIAAKWPGRLWRVQILDAATSHDQRASGGTPLPYARYTRAVAVRIVGEENLGQLFGPNGADVLQVLEAASNLARSRAELLATNRHAGAPAACDRLWREWMKSQDVPGDYPELLDGTLSLGTSGSPINGGLSVLHSVVFARATALDGDAATTIDDEDVWLAPPWSGASAALADAALALGAAAWATPSDRDILMHGWKSAYA
ncbi:hypothetical protein J2728_003514 [Caulobacter segnis]|nr:hypothetical protein [Caulobacter segnis]